MKKQAGLTLVEILVSAGLAILVLGGGFYLYTTINGPEVTNNTDTEPVASIDDNEPSINEELTVSEDAPDTEVEDVVEDEPAYYSDWQIYEDEEYEFEIGYPESFKFGGPNPKAKLLFSLSGSSEDIHYEFWIQKLNGKSLEEVFEEKLNLEDMSYFEWIDSQGGEVGPQIIGGKEWLFVDGSNKFYLDSHYMILIPNRDTYLIVDLGFPADSEFLTIKEILTTLRFI